MAEAVGSQHLALKREKRWMKAAMMSLWRGGVNNLVAAELVNLLTIFFFFFFAVSPQNQVS